MLGLRSTIKPFARNACAYSSPRRTCSTEFVFPRTMVGLPWPGRLPVLELAVRPASHAASKTVIAASSARTSVLRITRIVQPRVNKNRSEPGGVVLGALHLSEVAVGSTGVPVTGIPCADASPQVTRAIVAGAGGLQPVHPTFVAAADVGAVVVGCRRRRIAGEGEGPVLVAGIGGIRGLPCRIVPAHDAEDRERLGT